MSVYRDGGKMLVVSENGFGKKTELEEYKTQKQRRKKAAQHIKFHLRQAMFPV